MKITQLIGFYLAAICFMGLSQRGFANTEEEAIGQFTAKARMQYSPYPQALKAPHTNNGQSLAQLFFIYYDTASLHPLYSLKRLDITPAGLATPVTLFTHTDSLHEQTYSLQLSADGSKLALGRNRLKQHQPDFLDQPDKDVVLYHLLPDGTLNTALGIAGVTYINIPNPPATDEAVVGMAFNRAGNRLFVAMANRGVFFINLLHHAAPVVTAINPVTTPLLSFSNLLHVQGHGVEMLLAGTDSQTIYRIENLNSLPGVRLFCAPCPVDKNRVDALPGKSGGDSYIYTVNEKWVRRYDNSVHY
mgnify:CR=1 FL=1